MRTVESLQRLYVQLVREHLVAHRYDDAVQILHLLDVTPEMTELPMRDLFMALLGLSGALPAHQVGTRLGRTLPLFRWAVPADTDFLLRRLRPSSGASLA